MASLPFLIGKLPSCRLKEAVIILSCRLVLAQVVISSSTQEITNRKFGKNLRAGIQRLDYQFVILGLIGGACQVAIGSAQARFEINRGDQLLLGLRKFTLLQQNPA